MENCKFGVAKQATKDSPVFRRSTQNHTKSVPHLVPRDRQTIDDGCDVTILFQQAKIRMLLSVMSGRSSNDNWVSTCIAEPELHACRDMGIETSRLLRRQ